MVSARRSPSTSGSIVLAVNPAAGGGTAASKIDGIVHLIARAGFDVVVCQENNAEDLSRAIHNQLQGAPRALVAVGGDGTVNRALNALAPHFVVPLGVIPIGTGNDIAHSWGIPQDTDEAINHLVDALGREPLRVDVARADHGAGGSYFAGVYSAGFDAIVNERANRMRYPTGPSRYVLALLRELASLRPRHYRLSIDGVQRDVNALLIAVANGPSFGGGMQVVPFASVTDGNLDVFIVHPLPTLRFLALFPRVFSGGHVGHAAVEIVSATSVELDVDSVVGYADGERQGALPVHISIEPGALMVVA